MLLLHIPNFLFLDCKILLQSNAFDTRILVILLQNGCVKGKAACIDKLAYCRSQLFWSWSGGLWTGWMTIGKMWWREKHWKFCSRIVCSHAGCWELTEGLPLDDQVVHLGHLLSVYRELLVCLCECGSTFRTPDSSALYISTCSWVIFGNYRQSY